MSHVRVGSQNGSAIEIYFEDHGVGRPVVLVPGYPFTSQSWERQERALLTAGYRTITYDRRGFGMSSRPTIGYDVDTLADDLGILIEHLDLRDVVLVGAAMGTCEVTRYLGAYGSSRVGGAVLIAALPPFLPRTPDNPDGVDGTVVERMKAAILEDRFAFLEVLLTDMYNADVLGGVRISDQAWHACFLAAMTASPFATHACVDVWLHDFRADLARFDVPTLVIHGTRDRILPIDATAHRLPALLKDVEVVPVLDGPHQIGWTHAAEVNSALLAFLAR